MVKTVALNPNVLLVLGRINGITDAIWTLVLTLSIPFDVTVAVKLPAPLGFLENCTVKAVAVALVTVPSASLLNATILPKLVDAKPNPLMVTLVASGERLERRLVITGATVAT